MATSRTFATALMLAMLAGCGTGPTMFAGPTSGAAYDALKTARAPRELPKTENFSKVNGDLFRGGLPTDEDMKTLYKMGVRTVINLMSGSGAEGKLVAHEREVARSMNMNFVHLPLPFRSSPPQAMLDQYLAVFDQARILPAYIHCRHGRDRTGTMVAVYRINKEGWTGEKALEEMKSFGFKPSAYPAYAKFVLAYKPAKKAKAPARTGRREDEEAAIGLLEAFPSVGDVEASTGWNGEDS